jgi:hypothetical protein
MAKAKKKAVRRRKPVARKKAARKKPVARKKVVARKKAPARKKPAKRKLTIKKPPHKRLPRKPPKARKHGRHIPPHPILPAPGPWLLAHPAVADAILWQFQPASMTSVYVPPAATDKVAWRNWTTQQKHDLSVAYLDCVNWLGMGAPQVAMGTGGLTDMPTNQQTNTASNTSTVLESIDPVYFWKLYIAHVAMSLALEITQSLPWSIGGYNSMALRYLFDSSTMGWNVFTGVTKLGTYDVYVPALRADNLPKTSFGPPKWTFPFLAQRSLIGTSRINTIARVLQWMRRNLWHFIGSEDYGTCDAVWQYRGYPPMSRVIGGTIDTNNPTLGSQHWTMGCHGSVGLLHALLRVVNIPVQPIWVCGHELAFFITERLYMDHGDDPYNLNVRQSHATILDVLIEEPVYKKRFTSDLTINLTAMTGTACNNVGYSAQHFPP